MNAVSRQRAIISPERVWTKAFLQGSPLGARKSVKGARTDITGKLKALNLFTSSLYRSTALQEKRSEYLCMVTRKADNQFHACAPRDDKTTNSRALAAWRRAERKPAAEKPPKLQASTSCWKSCLLMRGSTVCRGAQVLPDWESCSTSNQGCPVPISITCLPKLPTLTPMTLYAAHFNPRRFADLSST